MDYILTLHVMEQMLERGIDQRDIDAVLNAPTWDVATNRNIRYDAMVDGRRLAVVVTRHDPTRIVTVFWTDEGR